jgi:hypothetical protein
LRRPTVAEVYTPSTDEVRRAYGFSNVPDGSAEFGRWLMVERAAAVEEFKRRMRADGTIPSWAVDRVANPYREETDRG